MSLTCSLVGCGVRGSYWAGILDEHPDVSLKALVDPDIGKAQALAANLKISAACHSALKPESDPWDFVVLATPPELHHCQVQACLAQGMHIICEKPLVEEFAQAIELVRLAQETNRQLMVGMNFRYLAASQHLRRTVQEQRLGPLAFGRFNYTRNRDGRRGDLNSYPLTMRHPMLLEQSVHHLDLIRYCYAQEVVRVCADMWNPPGSVYLHDSCVSVLMEMADGARVNYLGTWTAGWNGMEFAWRTDFRDGAVLQRNQFADVVECRLDPELGLTGPRFKDGDQAEEFRSVPLECQRPFVDDGKGLLDEFVSCINQGLSVRTSAHDHLGTLALLEACMQSNAAGTWIDLAHVFADHGAPNLWPIPNQHASSNHRGE